MFLFNNGGKSQVIYLLVSCLFSLCYPHFSLQQPPSVLCKLADVVYFLILIDAFVCLCYAFICRFDSLC